MAKKKAQSLPKTVFIYREKDGDESYLVASESMEGLADPEVRLVGTYKLIEEGKLRLTPDYQMAG